jgi:hypothetical protein
VFPFKKCQKTVQKALCTVASVCIPTGDALSDAKNGCFAHFCTDAPMQHGALGADSANHKTLYKPTVTNFKIVPMHTLQILLHYPHGKDAM